MKTRVVEGLTALSVICVTMIVVWLLLWAVTALTGHHLFIAN